LNLNHRASRSDFSECAVFSKRTVYTRRSVDSKHTVDSKHSVFSRHSVFSKHTVISLCGDLDLANCDELSARLSTLAGRANGRIALNLSRVTFLDCSGLRSLLALDQRVREVGGEVCIAATSPAVDRIFELLAFYLESSGLFRSCPL
jgi:anti-anti-sigma factor